MLDIQSTFPQVMMVQATIETFESLTDLERKKIEEVLQRDLELKKVEEEKLDELRQEIQALRKHSIQSQSSSTDEKKFSHRPCLRCGTSLGLIFKVGTLCSKCQQRVCSNCRKPNGSKWICVLCYKNREYSAVTGDWFFNQARNKSLRENDYTPNVSSANAATDYSASEYISGVLLGQLKKLERRRQVNAIDTRNQILLAAVRNKSVDQQQQHIEIKMRKKNENKMEPTKTDISTNNSKRMTWNSSQISDVVLLLTSRKNKNRPLSIAPTPNDDVINDSVNLQKLPIPEVRIDEEFVIYGEEPIKLKDKSATMRLRINDKLLRSPSVPAFKETDKIDAKVNAARFQSFREPSLDDDASKNKTLISVVNNVEIIGKPPTKNKNSFILPSKSVSDIFSASNASSRETLSVEDGWSATSGDSFRLKAPSVISLTSLYSNAGEANAGKFEIKGRVLISLEYDCRAAVLEAHIRQCEDLAAVDVKRNRSNAYVKTYLLPDRSASGKRKTKIKRHTLNPTFDETLRYPGLTKSELEERTLLISVWHSDLLGRNDFLGEVHVRMSDYPWGSEAYGFWYELESRKNGEDSSDSFRGELSLSIKYVPTTVDGNDKKLEGSFQCLVRGARHLQSIRSSGTADSFVKAYMHPISNKSSKQKSIVVKNDLNPVWDCTFDYGGVIDAEFLKESSLELTVWDHQRFHANEFLGGVRLNLGSGSCKNVKVDWMDAQDKERTLWAQMIDRPNVWCDATLLLRTNMEPKL